ncbi:MAG TPA: oligosaccharide flippase family protein [Rubricoccaceae bacterium]
MLDVALVGGGVYVSYGALFAVSVLVNRGLGTAELGYYGLALAVGQLAVQSVTDGFSALLKRDVSVAPARAAELAGVYGTLKATAAGTLYLAVLMAAFVGEAAGTVPPALAWTLAFVVGAVAVESVGRTFPEALQASGRNAVYSAVLIGGAFAVLALVGGALLAGAGALAVYAALLVARTVAAGGALAVFWQSAGRVAPGVTGAEARRIVGASWPLVVNGLVFVATARAGTLVLAQFGGAEDVGVFTFASSVVAGASMVASSAGIVLFPVLCREHEAGGRRLRTVLYVSTAALALAGAAAVGALRVAEPLVVAVFGRLPAGAIPVLRLLSLGLVPIFGSVPAGYLFTAIGQQREGMMYSFVQAAVTVSLLVAFTARAGVTGTAAAIVVAQALMLVVAVVWLDTRHLAPRAAEAISHTAR